MSEYARVAVFEVDDAALDALVAEINNADGPPPGVPGTRITVLADRQAGQMAVSIRFASEEDMRRGSEALEAMSPPDVGSVRRVSLNHYEVVIDRQA